MNASGNAGHRLGKLLSRPNVGSVAVRPEQGTGTGLTGGLNWPLGPKGAALFVPSALPDTAVPLVVLFHGAGSEPGRILPVLQYAAEREGVLVLAPRSVAPTWDVIRGGFGPDVEALDEALDFLFDAFPVDPERIAVAGFSDGASYALSLGLINGSLFSSILAFSPGFVVPGALDGRPNVFISHGVADQVLPIDRTSRRIVPALRAEGYAVDYREFDGGHMVPPDMVAAAVVHLRWGSSEKT